MFTGLVEDCGTVGAIEPSGPGKRLTIVSKRFFEKRAVGDSVAINGCCLTVVDRDADRAKFEAGEETLRCTNLGILTMGARVNLESAVCAGDPLGGHLVTGHVDAVGKLAKRTDNGDWSEIWFAVPNRLTRQMASKGSVAVDGISLTLVDVTHDQFSVALIPHTLATTTLGERRVGDIVNIETDVLAKYVERQLAIAGLVGPQVQRKD